MTPEGFEIAAREHGTRVQTFAAWLLGDVEEAQDVTQDSLLRLWQHRDRVAPEAARTWLLRTARHLAIDRIRARASRAEPGPHPGHPSGECVAMANDDQALLARAVATLPFRDRAAILLREVNGLTYAELAIVLDMPLGSVKAALHRARRQLRDMLTAMETRT